MSEQVASHPNTESNDILFRCDHCCAPLVVDRAAAGMTLNCQRCEKPTRVPTSTDTHKSNAHTDEMIADLQRRLQENDSQRTEITGYINQISIQLHRWQHRLQTLNDRRAELQAEMATLTRDNT